MVVESIAKLVDALYAHEVVKNHADNLRPIRKYSGYSHSYMILYRLRERFSEQKRRNKLAYLRDPIKKRRKLTFATPLSVDLKRYKPTTLQMTPFENERMEKVDIYIL